MKFKLALIGCGRISQFHLAAIAAHAADLDLVAVCDLIEEKAKARASTHLQSFPRAEVAVYTDYRKMLLECKPEIVVVATESGYHPAIAIDSLQAGAHVIVEKPMALSTRDADRMIAVAKEMKKKLAVCFQNRFNPPVQKAFEAVANKRFGKVLHGMIQIRWNRNDNYYKEAPWRGTWELDGGTLMNQCTHGIDLLQWLMGGEVKRVNGVTRKFLRPIEAEDFGAAILEFENGAIGIIEGSADVYPKNLNETLSLFGEKGTVVIGGLAVNHIETWRFEDGELIGDREETVVDNNYEDPKTVYGSGHSPLYADFIGSLISGKEPLVSGAEGKKALEIVLAIYQAMLAKQPVAFPIDFSTTQMVGVFKKELLHA